MNNTYLSVADPCMSGHKPETRLADCIRVVTALTLATENVESIEEARTIHSRTLIIKERGNQRTENKRSTTDETDTENAHLIQIGVDDVVICNGTHGRRDEINAGSPEVTREVAVDA
jgi:hypothetical protein